MAWPTDRDELVELQERLARQRPARWVPTAATVGGCFVCFARGGGGPGASGDPGWAGAVTLEVGTGAILAEAVTTGVAGAPYRPGLLALREGPLQSAATEALEVRPGVLMVNATGRDHPRRAGLALHLGWALGIPSVGVTDRTLVATGEPPPPGMAGARSPLWIDGEQVGWWLRTRHRARPLAVSPGWRTDLETAAEVVISASGDVRTPEPIRQARRLARTARSGGG